LVCSNVNTDSGDRTPTEWSAVKKGNEARNVLMLGQLDKLMRTSIIMSNMKVQLFHLLKIDLSELERFAIIKRCSLSVAQLMRDSADLTITC
jgi:hypothetical protein